MNIITDIKNLSTYKQYSKVITYIDDFLQEKNYLKVDLPVLSPALIPESYLEVFETEFRYFDKKEKLYLTPSPELFLKRLLIAGVGDCYYLGKTFRNSEPNSSKHTPEFSMLELYKVGAGYMDIADIVLQLLQFISIKLYNKPELNFRNYKVSLEKWEKMTVAEAFQKYAGVTEDELFDHNKFLQKAKLKNYVIDNFSYEDVWSQIYTQEIEPHLGKNGYPTLLYEYPKEFASLAKHNSDGKTARRFEFYIAGLELGNCYEELTDWQEQERRFKNDELLRKQNGKIQHPVDWGFIDALKKGLPTCAGIAIGVERLGMIFADVDSIDKIKLIRID